ncbi:MAG: hypothetical protein GX196_04595 [Clostridiaceae bacterium]|nr:hypothetical protein [Clostridiaceae bacterium]
MKEKDSRKNKKTKKYSPSESYPLIRACTKGQENKYDKSIEYDIEAAKDWVDENKL